ALQTANGLAGSAAGNVTRSLTGSGAATGPGSGSSGQFAAGGHSAASGTGARSPRQGTPVLSPDGDRIGTVRHVLPDSLGRIHPMLVKVDGATAILPAGNSAASGNAVMSVMSEGEIKRTAAAQQSEADQPSN